MVQPFLNAKMIHGFYGNMRGTDKNIRKERQEEWNVFFMLVNIPKG
jgi:hypothetical protein